MSAKGTDIARNHLICAPEMPDELACQRRTSRKKKLASRYLSWRWLSRTNPINSTAMRLEPFGARSPLLDLSDAAVKALICGATDWPRPNWHCPSIWVLIARKPKSARNPRLHLNGGSIRLAAFFGPGRDKR